VQKTTWLEIEPVDTLFFRGAEAMEAGENHEVDTMFPPMPSTIIGAIRTAFMRQKGIEPAAYCQTPEKWQDEHPFLGLPNCPGFSLIGPFFSFDSGVLMLPAPAHWFADLPGSDKMVWNREYNITAAEPLAENGLGLSGSVANPFWVKNPPGRDMKPLSGYWASIGAFKKMACGGAKVLFTNGEISAGREDALIVPQAALYVKEERLGIALTGLRTVREGHLYNAGHVRLREGVKLVAGVVSQHDFPLCQREIIQLGGEQRVCAYRVVELNIDINSNSKFWYAAAPVPIEAVPDEWQSAPRASGKLLRVGGWDMQRKFHKPMAAWLPAGTVIAAQKVANNLPQFIQI